MGKRRVAGGGVDNQARSEGNAGSETMASGDAAASGAPLSEHASSVREVIARFVSQEFLHGERQLSKKDAMAVVNFVLFVVASSPENPQSSHYTPATSALRAEAEKAFRRRAWEYLAQPRNSRLLDRTCTDALAACYIRLSAHIAWKQVPRQILFTALNLLAAAVEEGPAEILENMKYWSELKGDEKPYTRYQKKEALRIREDFLGGAYGWNAIERVDPNFTGGSSLTYRWLIVALVFLIFTNVAVFLWGNGYIHV